MKTTTNERGRLSAYVLPFMFMATAAASHTASADIYSYVDKNGTRWLTNVAVNNKNAKLIARTPQFKNTTRRAAATNYDENLSARGIRVNSCTRLSHQQVEARTAPHLAAIQKYARQYGVEENLVRAIIRQESCFNQSARSHVGATGLMQLMPGTADVLGVNMHDSQQNIRGGIKYIAQMLQKFDGDKRLALAAYNAGPGAVIKYGGVPPYRETQDYVVKVLAEYKRLEKNDQPAAIVSSYARSSYQTVGLRRHQGGFGAGGADQYQ